MAGPGNPAARGGGRAPVELRAVAYDHADAQPLVAAVQQEYTARYGGPDDSPVDAADFAPPRGRFFVAYVAGEPVGMGGWRTLGEQAPAGLAGPVVEIKRMFVAAAHRRRGHARVLLNELEVSAAAAGAPWIVLETGGRQPEAIRLYESGGYRPVPPFGHYSSTSLSKHLGKHL